MPLANIRFSLVDVPDLRLLPEAFPSLTDTWTGAGFLPAFLHRSLNLLAFMRWRLRLPSLTNLARICRWANDTFQFGEDRGGMFIEVTDATDARKAASWHLDRAKAVRQSIPVRDHRRIASGLRRALQKAQDPDRLARELRIAAAALSGIAGRAF